MAEYATLEDVRNASFDPIAESRDTWLSYQLDAAEALLIGKIPRLADITTVSPADRTNAKHIIVAAVLRFYDNPKGIKTEVVDEQSYTRFDTGSARTGIYFTDDELERLRPTPKRRIGNISVAPPRIGQV